MKHSNRRLKNIQSFFIASLAILTVTSCTKNWDDHNNYPPGGAAAVSIVHAAPLTLALDVALDKNWLPVNNFSYTDRIVYFPAYTGDRKLSVYNQGSNTPLFQKNISLARDKYYTVFIVDTLSKMDAVLLRDSTKGAGEDSVRIRFANMSPDAGNLNLYIQGNSTPVATNIAYKTAGNFISLKAANNVIFEIRKTGQNTVLATSESMTLGNRRIYTIWSSGFKSYTTNNGKLRVESFTHGY